jgi:hypothetical protein
MHDVEAYVDLDYTVSKYEADFVDSGDNNKDIDNGTELLAYMAGQKSSCGDVWQVLASKQTPDKQKKQQVNEGASKQMLQLMVLLTICTREKPSSSKVISILLKWQNFTTALGNMILQIWNKR